MIFIFPRDSLWICFDGSQHSHGYGPSPKCEGALEVRRIMSKFSLGGRGRGIHLGWVMLFDGNSWEQKLEFLCPRANIDLHPCFYLDEFSHSFQPEKYRFNQRFLGVKSHQNEKKEKEGYFVPFISIFSEKLTKILKKINRHIWTLILVWLVFGQVLNSFAI